MKITREHIKEIFLASGFTIKEGQTDLKEYVYTAAEALLALANFEQDAKAVKRILAIDPVTNEAVVASKIINSTDAIGIPEQQEPKYTTNGTHFVNRATGEVIPHDEPVFILRAKDWQARAALQRYLTLILNQDISEERFKDYSPHYKAVEARVRQFREFAKANPKRMKNPDT